MFNVQFSSEGKGHKAAMNQRITKNSGECTRPFKDLTLSTFQLVNLSTPLSNVPICAQTCQFVLFRAQTCPNGKVSVWSDVIFVL